MNTPKAFKKLPKCFVSVWSEGTFSGTIRSSNQNQPYTKKFLTAHEIMVRSLNTEIAF